MPRFDRERPPGGAGPLWYPSYDDVGYGTEEPLYAGSPAVSPDLPEPTPWWEIAPERPSPPTRPSVPPPSPGGVHPGPGGTERLPRYTSLSHPFLGGGSGRPSARGPSPRSLREAKQEQVRQQRMAAMRVQEAIKEERRRAREQKQLEKKKLKVMEKLQKERLELARLQTLKPVWGI